MMSVLRTTGCSVSPLRTLQHMEGLAVELLTFWLVYKYTIHDFDDFPWSEKYKSGKYKR